MFWHNLQDHKKVDENCTKGHGLNMEPCLLPSDSLLPGNEGSYSNWCIVLYKDNTLVSRLGKYLQSDGTCLFKKEVTRYTLISAPNAFNHWVEKWR